MKFDLIVAGVGGQGILSISFVVDNASLEDGLHFKQSEVHGMAQRGGAVVSHLRISDEQIFSDLVPGASADMILSMEPLEALRYMHYLSPGGRVISSINPVVNIPDYPDEAELLDRLQEQCAGSVLVNAAELARAAGSPRAQNMVLLGAASRHLPLEIKTLEKFVGVLFKAKGERVVDVNMTAFRGGALAGAFYENLIAAGVGAADAAAVATRLEPVDYSAGDIDGWRSALEQSKGGALRAWLWARPGLLDGAALLARLAGVDLSTATEAELETAVTAD